MVTRSYESILTMLAAGSISVREANRALRVPQNEFRDERRERILAAQRKLAAMDAKTPRFPESTGRALPATPFVSDAQVIEAHRLGVCSKAAASKANVGILEVATP